MFLAGIKPGYLLFPDKTQLKKIRQNEELWFYIAVAIIAGSIATITLACKFEQEPLRNHSVKDSSR